MHVALLFAEWVGLGKRLLDSAAKGEQKPDAEKRSEQASEECDDTSKPDRMMSTDLS
jgi:hypothetical protein